MGRYDDVEPCEADGKVFARKLISITSSSKVTREDIENEARAVRKLCSRVAQDNIVEVYCHKWLSRERETYIFDMEYCEKTLDIHIKTNLLLGPPGALAITDLRVREAIKIAEDITNALKFIHELDEVHRDLKPSNSMRHPPSSV